MQTILVKSIYDVDTISKGNSKAWIKFIEFMSSQTGDVEFDFKGIEVVQPWSTPEFKIFMQDERVHLKLWHSESTVRSINIMCTLNGLKTDRAVNEVVAVEKQPSREEVQIDRIATELQGYFEIENGVVTFNLYKRFDQIGVPLTVAYIERALKMFISSNKCEVIKLEARNISVQSGVLERLTNLIPMCEELGVKLEISSEDAEVMNKVGMYTSLSLSKTHSDMDKIRAIKAMLHPGKVGMLIKYKEGRAKDEFGRSGKGKPISCRVCIYQGMKKIGDTICVVFRTYNGDTLYTQEHWRLEHDNDRLERLDSKDEVIAISEFGMYNEFMGSKFHLITPVQETNDGYTEMYGLDSSGKFTRARLTIPERIKEVFDDWGIEYDIEGLNKYITETKIKLAKNGI